jgi:hypothetical protein
MLPLHTSRHFGSIALTNNFKAKEGGNNKKNTTKIKQKRTITKKRRGGNASR